MRRAVVDASVASKWVVEETYSAKAALLLDWDSCHAPDHWLAEAANVLWSKVFRRDLAAADAEERIAALMRAPIVTVPIATLLPRAYAISVAREVPIYDSLYVALAERHDIPLVTADERLIRKLSADPGFAKLMLWVGDLSA